MGDIQGAVSGEAGCAGLEPSRAHGWRSTSGVMGSGCHRGGHVAQDRTPRNTDSKGAPKEKEKGCQDRQSPLQRRELWEEEEVSAMSNTGPPSQIRAKQTSTGSVM